MATRTSSTGPFTSTREAFPDYGKLSHVTTNELSLRPLELSVKKKNLLDFALWRPVVLVEGRWDSPWGRGSPGWHIQDTAVTLTNFGPQYDIHGGALRSDLSAP